MSTSRAQATAAPLNRTIGGVKLRLRPPTDKDYAEFTLWVQDQHVAFAKRSVVDMAPDQANHCLAAAISEASKMDITKGAALDKMVTVGGAAFLLWIMARPFSEIDYDKCHELLFNNAQAMIETMDVHDVLTGGMFPKKKRATKKRAGATRDKRKKRKKRTT